MSLTSELHRSDNPVSRFFAEHFPDRDGFWNAWSEKVWQFPSIRPEGPLADYPWALVGGAFDYRIRVCWQPYFAENTVAAVGAEVAQKIGMSMAARMWTDLRDRWNLMMHYTLSSRRALSADREEALARMSVALAAYEQIARSGRQDRLLAGTLKIDEVLGRVPDAVVADLLNLLDEFRRSEDRFLHPQSTVLNPVFDGSRLVGGADGDVILDRYLWDFKTTIHPTRASNNYWPYQLLGYGLLDLKDQYEFQGAGIYLVRQGVWISWTWAEMFELLGADPDVAIREWRRTLVAHVGRQSLRPVQSSRAI